MSKRINIVLPTATIQTIDRLAKPGMRSKFIKTAVDHYVANRSTEALRAQLERAAVRDQDLDREVAADWFAVDRETCQLTRRTQATTKAGHPSRGEVYLTALDPTLGLQIQKTWPALIVQNDISNRLSE